MGGEGETEAVDGDLGVTAAEIWAAFDEAVEVLPVDEDPDHKTADELAVHWIVGPKQASRIAGRAVAAGTLVTEMRRRRVNGHLRQVRLWWVV